jgi:hypothetical protein
MSNNEADDVLLSALLDKELSAEDAARLEQRLAREPKLRARLDSLERADSAVRDRYAGVVAEPLPQSLRELLDGNELPVDNVVPLARPTRVPSLALPMALAASVALAIGVSLGIVLAPTRQAGDAAGLVADSGLVAPGTALFDVFETVPSAESRALPGDIIATPVLTFGTANGDYCREIELASVRGATQMLGCRRDAEWRLILASFTASANTDGVYRPASGPSPALDAAIDDLIEGAPLDAAAERELMSRGWER